LILSVSTYIRAEMSVTIDEIRSQPELWARAAELAPALQDVLPPPGANVAVIGCGTSWFMAQAYAALREGCGHGRTDAFAASEMPSRAYDVVVALSRSGTTTEVAHALMRSARSRTVAITAVPDTPVAVAADDVVLLDFADEQSVVQTRFATTALSLLRAHEGFDLAGPVADARTALDAPLPVAPGEADRWAFLGRGWTVGLASEAALKLRESAQAWTEAYPAFEYRHGPISIAGPGAAVWFLGSADEALLESVRAAGAIAVADDLDPLASLILAQRTGVALAEAAGLDPDRPRNLSRSVVLSEVPQ
jgi:fructoselysine-6-P-deglycase FrlB-like protein